MSENLGTMTDFSPDDSVMLKDVLRGLALPQKNIPSLYFYDQRGSELFDAITELPEYYPTRTEIGILERHGAEMAAALGPGVRLIELGSGSALKTELLLGRLEDPAAYVPVEISREHLLAAAARIAADFPDLEVMPVTADFTEPFDLPEPARRRVERNVAFFPGSTIGNFPRGMAADLLAATCREVGAGGAMLIGVDLVKDRATLERAYNDAAGVTAQFNLNLLVRLNRELGADFDVAAFRHQAVWDEDAARIEMRLVSTRAQRVQVAGRPFEFAAGEVLVTEYSHKYTPAVFRSLAEGAGFRVARTWTDPEGLFSVQLLEVPGAAQDSSGGT
ncbi:L-histidine N(alpha)-methyltransferase [Thioalkalivibrio sp. XN279]|uniref:L-histidine N(alpha)-methyltransferase n=1 Tax=Thioalkalivibrio sp. XN279 TaxID=2714953 RepID=UPI00140BD8DC|nr:L-histidine N(alpha)-methyltransferase [Thioalkalivibrio sp. XN279]NHA13527.1 L-histidine N(alpha)-methyltransferase [Thioalkalivibrio sp. XN279]